jgi:hypothetical protein
LLHTTPPESWSATRAPAAGERQFLLHGYIAGAELDREV